MTPPLTDLISRLERASGPDRALDRALAVRLLDQRTGAPCYTASLDAALALVESAGLKELWTIGVEYTPASDHPSGDKACAYIKAQENSGRIAHRTPALALLLALLRSLEAAA